MNSLHDDADAIELDELMARIRKRRRPAAKKRDDKDAVWVMRYVKYLRENDYDTGAELSRLRRIAKRLNGGRKVGA